MSDTGDTLLIGSYYEDLNGEILSLTTSDECVIVAFECDDWSNWSQYTNRRRFQIVGEQVVECTLIAPYRSVGALYSTTGMLIEEHHRSEWIQVYWKSKAKSADEVIGRLYQNHELLANCQKDLREYLVASAQTLGFSSGLLLDGPAEYAISQANSVRDLMEVYTLTTHRQPEPVVGIGIDDSYLICHSIAINEIACE